MSKHDQPADLLGYRCYRIKDILYVPHYNERYFVAPGYPKQSPRVYTNIELLNAGATVETRRLWKRKEHQEV